jgi:hypothetical protein
VGHSFEKFARGILVLFGSRFIALIDAGNAINAFLTST